MALFHPRPAGRPRTWTFYPISLLISGYDILFFWDARMIMMGLHLTRAHLAAEGVPFRRLYLHSLVRTAEGAKMSKTKGTGVDPLELTKFGTDALRYMLASMAAPGTDIILSEDRIFGARAFAKRSGMPRDFCSSIWKRADKPRASPRRTGPAGDSRCGAVRGSGRRRSGPSLDFRALVCGFSAGERCSGKFPLSRSGQLIYHFFWGDFCDWYIEWVKPQLTAADRSVAFRRGEIFLRRSKRRYACCIR